MIAGGKSLDRFSEGFNRYAVIGTDRMDRDLPTLSLSQIDKRCVESPFFSICIPQFNRTSFLIEACKSLAVQSFTDFEVCISDDCSTDGQEDRLLAYLHSSDMSFIYRKQEKNTRYDGNIRASINMSRGKFCFLLGNDDALAASNTLQNIYDEMQCYESIGVVITNFEDFATGTIVRRVQQSGLRGSGPIIAARYYRDVSFVSGVILNGPRARALETAKWDGSEMYQMYLTCRILAEGRSLLTLNRVTIRKDIHVEGEVVDSYAMKPRLSPCPIVERQLPLGLIGRLVDDAISPFICSNKKQEISELVLRQLLCFTYPYWILEYRRAQSWKYAVGIALGMRLKNITQGITLGSLRRLRLQLLYAIITGIALCIPGDLFRRMYPLLYKIAKSRFRFST